MHKLKVVLYSLFTAACIAFFAVILFPQKIVKNYVATAVSRNAPGWSLNIEQAGIGFPMGLKLENTGLFHLNRHLLQADAVFIRPHWLSLLTAEGRFDLKMEAHGGSISGTAEVTSPARPERFNFTAALSDMKLGSIPALNDDPSIDLTGDLGGRIELSAAENGSAVLTAQLVLSDCVAVLASKRLNQGRFRFDRIEADARVQNRQLKLQRCVFRGEQINGALTGKGVIKTPLEKTELFLRGTLQADQVQAERSSIRLRAQPKPTGEGGGLNFRIQGPVDDLRFYL